MSNGRFYVSKGKIKDKTRPNDWFTVKEVCALLNKQEDLIKRQNDELNKATDLLYECEEQFREYNGRGLSNDKTINYSKIISKIMELTK